MASLNFAVDELCPRLVHAIVKTQATCPTEYVTGQTCHYLNRSDAKLLTGKLQKQAQDAEALLVRGREMVTHSRGGHDMSMELGQWDCQVVKALFGKISRNGNNVTVQEVASEWLEAMFTSPTNKEPKVEAASSSASFIETVEFGGTSTNASLITMKNLGFKAGVVIEPKVRVKGTVVVQQMKVAYVNDDGSVGMHAINELGNVVDTQLHVLTMQKCIDTYKMAQSVINVDERTHIKHGRAKTLFIESLVLTSIHQSFHEDHDSIRMQTAPTRAMINTQDVASGTVVFRPMVQSVKYDSAATEKPATVANDMAYVASTPTWKGDTIEATVKLVAMTGDKSEYCPYWMVCTTADKDAANLTLAYTTVDCTVKGTMGTVSVTLPCVKTTKAVKAGERFLIFKEPPTKHARKQEVLLGGSKSEPVAKKRKSA